MNAFTIKDLENLSGIKAHTIRIWEQRYHFLKPQRTNTNIRYYTNDELKTVLNISLLNKYGFKISHIDRMQPKEIHEKVMSLVDAQAIQERVVNELVQHMVDLDMDRFEHTLAHYIAAKGVERAVIQIIFPFLERTGILWQTGNINPAQEHLVSNVIRQKLIAGIETAVPLSQTSKTFLLFLPENEHHELGLLFVYYLLKKRGLQTVYLGANIPMKDVQYVLELKKPDVVYVHLTSTASTFSLEKFINRTQQFFKGTPLLVSGLLTQQYRKDVPPSVQLKRSLSEVTQYLASL